MTMSQLTEYIELQGLTNCCATALPYSVVGQTLEICNLFLLAGQHTRLKASMLLTRKKTEIRTNKKIYPEIMGMKGADIRESHTCSPFMTKTWY
jgi:hypothetical protein